MDFVCNAPYLNVFVACGLGTASRRHGEVHFSIANQSTTTSIMNMVNMFSVWCVYVCPRRADGRQKAIKKLFIMHYEDLWTSISWSYHGLHCLPADSKVCKWNPSFVFAQLVHVPAVCDEPNEWKKMKSFHACCYLDRILFASLSNTKITVKIVIKFVIYFHLAPGTVAPHRFQSAHSQPTIKSSRRKTDNADGRHWFIHTICGRRKTSLRSPKFFVLEYWFHEWK